MNTNVQTQPNNTQPNTLGPRRRHSRNSSGQRPYGRGAGRKQSGSRDSSARGKLGRSAHKQRGGRRDNREKAPARRQASSNIPPVKPGDIRVIPLGGVEEIGKNMTVIETSDDIVIIDMGFQFREEDTPGVDYILPNIKYLEERKEKIRAVFITHGHLDHIGGIPYMIDKLGNPPIYSRSLTTVMIKKRQEEFPQLPELKIHVVEKDDQIRVGNVSAKFFAVTHTIPDSMGVILKTPYGNIVAPGDIKLDHHDGVVTEAEEKEYAVFDNEKTLLLMADSTNVENPGFSTPEREVHKGLEQVITGTKRRLIIGTFASQIERMLKIIEISEQCGKKVVVEGRSMKNNIEIVRQTGMLKAKKGTIISVEEMGDHPPEKIVVLATGAQGDEFAALMRMANQNHKYFKIGKRDTVLFSSSVIPGNERAVEKLKDNLARLGAKIIHYRSSDMLVHATGHGNRGELEWLQRKIKPKFFMPVHGNHYKLRVHEDLAISTGLAPENIIVADNGSILEVQEKGSKFVRREETAPSGAVMVDGFSVGDVQEVLIRDRKMLSEDGMFVIIASVNPKTGKLRKSPDIISRGFVYLRDSQDLLSETRRIAKKTVEDQTKRMNPINFEYIKSLLSDSVAKHLFQKTAKRPIVIPVVLGM